MLDDGPAIDNRAVRSKLATWAVRTSGLKYTSYRTMFGNVARRAAGSGELHRQTRRRLHAAGHCDLRDRSAGRGRREISDPELAESAGRFQALLLSSPSSRIAGGTDEIMRNIIAERVLGLPGDIRVDKDVPFNKIPTKGR